MLYQIYSGNMIYLFRHLIPFRETGLALNDVLGYNGMEYSVKRRREEKRHA